MDTPYGIALHKLVGIRRRAAERQRFYVAVKAAIHQLSESTECFAGVRAGIYPKVRGAMHEQIYGDKAKGIVITVSAGGILTLWVSPSKRFAYGCQEEAPAS